MAAADGPSLGDVVACTVTSQHPWGVVVQVEGWPGVPASVDMVSAGTHPGDLVGAALVGTSMTAVVVEVRADAARPTWYRLSNDPADLEYSRRTNAVPPRWLPLQK